MKRYTLKSILYIIGIAGGSILCYSLWQEGLHFSCLSGGLVLLLVCIRFHLLHVKQMRLLAQVTDNFHQRDMTQSSPVSLHDGEMQQLTEKLHTAMQEFQQRLLDEEAKLQYYETLLDKVDTAVIVAKAGGQIAWMNQAAMHHLGEIGQLPDKLLEAARSDEMTLARLEVKGMELEMIVSCTQLSTHEDEQLLICLKDVHRVLEYNEIEAWKKLIRVLSHEIMNSLTPIISLSETLCKGEAFKVPSEGAWESMKQAMDAIYRRSRGLLKFINSYRSLTHLPPPLCREVKVSDIWVDMRKLFPGGEFCFEPPEEGLTLWGDRAQVEQVLINVLKNATEACMYRPQKCIQTEAHRMSGGRVRITVADNGEGMSADVVSRIFTPFFTTKASGSGVGLTLCKEIMAGHNGHIAVKSAKGLGTNVELTFEPKPRRPWDR